MANKIGWKLLWSNILVSECWSHSCCTIKDIWIRYSLFNKTKWTPSMMLGFSWCYEVRFQVCKPQEGGYDREYYTVCTLLGWTYRLASCRSKTARRWRICCLQLTQLLNWTSGDDMSIFYMKWDRQNNLM